MNVLCKIGKWVFFSTALCFSTSAYTGIINVTETEGNSSMNANAAIISAPNHILEDNTFNRAMQGFNEAQSIFTTAAHAIDGGNFIAAGSNVSSHMIFLNSPGNARLSHTGVQWTFDGIIIGVMSDSGGFLEASSSYELGNPLTNYTNTFGGSGAAAPFGARGLENNDSYIVDGNTITVNMTVTEPGDWIRVITISEPHILTVITLALGIFGFIRLATHPFSKIA